MEDLGESSGDRGNARPETIQQSICLRAIAMSLQGTPKKALGFEDLSCLAGMTVSKDDEWNTALLRCSTCEAFCVLDIKDSLKFGYVDEGTTDKDVCTQPYSSK